MDGFAALNPPCNPCGVHVVLLLDSHAPAKETIHPKFLVLAQSPLGLSGFSVGQY